MTEKSKPEVTVGKEEVKVERKDGKPVSPEAKEAIEGLVKPKEEPKELTPKEKEDLEKQKKYFAYLQQGAYFLKFINDDLERDRKNNTNRANRRRIEKAIKKGQITRDIIDTYRNKIDQVLAFVNKELERPVAEEKKEEDAK